MSLPDAPLVCPKCHSRALRSDETAVIGYPVTLARVNGLIEVTYTGESYETFDEGTVYVGDLWCRDCGYHFAPHELVAEKNVGEEWVDLQHGDGPEEEDDDG